MFGTLIESRARRHRRTGGAALSIAAHVAIIGVTTAATMHGTAAPRTPIKPEFVVFTATPAPKPIERRGTTARPTSSRTVVPAPITLVIAPPTMVPTALPEIDLTSRISPDFISIGGPPSTSGSGRQPVGPLGLTDDGAASDKWSYREVLMNIVSSVKPRYPETLRQSGVGGRVLVQFTVDTTGRVDMASVRVMQSTHDLFTQAVRSALSAFRFKPAEVNGKRMAALAEMPFEFQVR
jgi:protein TonB